MRSCTRRLGTAFDGSSSGGFLTVSLAALCLVAGCGSGPAPLSRADATSIPAGTASGAAASGRYRIDTLALGCSGSCRPLIGGTVCEVGDRQVVLLELVQADGRLTVDARGNDYVSRMSGGIDVDGRFAVGGFRQAGGAAVDIVSQATGTLSETGALEGTLEFFVTGSGLECRGDVELRGVRRADG